MPVTLSVITTSFPAEERPKAVGVWAGVAGGCGIIGLFVAAAIINSSTWPWVFAFPIAIAMLAFVGTVAVVSHSRSHKEGRVRRGRLRRVGVRGRRAGARHPRGA